MVSVRIIAVGDVKEKYYRDAVGEYMKRLGAYCRPELIELREARMPDEPGDAQIASALDDEAGRILAAVPPRAYVVVLAVEGEMLASEALAALIETEQSRHSCVCFIIGSSYGLSDRVKSAADMRLSLSKCTFPHRLFRVMLLETVYRSFTIIKGTRYHK